MTASAEERVQTGMEWLDERYSDHAQRVNLSILHLANTAGHPFAQAVGRPCSYFTISQMLDDIDLVPLGFAPMGIFTGVDFADERALTEEWRRQYKARREADSVTQQGLAGVAASIGDAAHLNAGSEHVAEEPEGVFESALSEALGRIFANLGDALASSLILVAPQQVQGEGEEFEPSDGACRTYQQLNEWLKSGPQYGTGFAAEVNLMDATDLVVLAAGMAIKHRDEVHPGRHWLRCSHHRLVFRHAIGIFQDTYRQQFGS